MLLRQAQVFVGGDWISELFCNIREGDIFRIVEPTGKLYQDSLGHTVFFALENARSITATTAYNISVGVPIPVEHVIRCCPVLVGKSMSITEIAVS